MQQIFLAIFCLLEVETIYVGCLNISWQVVQKNLSKASWFDISPVLFIYYSFMCTKIGGLFQSYKQKSYSEYTNHGIKTNIYKG